MWSIIGKFVDVTLEICDLKYLKNFKMLLKIFKFNFIDNLVTKFTKSKVTFEKFGKGKAFLLR